MENRDVCEGFLERKGIVVKVLRPLKAIRAKCLDCCAGQVKEIRFCPITGCALWPYRLGRRPTPKKGSPPVIVNSSLEQPTPLEVPTLSTEKDT